MPPLPIPADAHGPWATLPRLTNFHYNQVIKFDRKQSLDPSPPPPHPQFPGQTVRIAIAIINSCEYSDESWVVISPRKQQNFRQISVLKTMWITKINNSYKVCNSLSNVRQIRLHLPIHTFISFNQFKKYFLKWIYPVTILVMTDKSCVHPRKNFPNSFLS